MIKPKLNNIKYLISIASILLFSGCKNDRLRDPLLGLRLGSENKEWKEKVRLLEETGLLRDKMYNNEYETYLVYGQDSIKTVTKINHDNYLETDLLSVKINLNTDTVRIDSNRNYYLRGSGKPKSESIEKSLKWLTSLYGKPDKVFYAKDSMLNFSDYMYFDSTALVHRWTEQDYQIELFQDISKFEFTPGNDQGTYILFLVKDYKNKLALEKERIRLTLKPKDIITTSYIDRPKFSVLSYNVHKIELTIPMIQRRGVEEPRGVSDIKFDVIFKNQFKEEVGRIENFVLHFDKPINGYEPYQQPMNGYAFYVNYNPFSQDGRQFTFIRDNIKNITPEFDIKKIVFEDGQVLE